MRNAVTSHLIYPLAESVMGTCVLTQLKTLEQTQWCSPAALQELQNHKLRRLVEHAYLHVPYYRQIFEERKLTPQDIVTTADLVKLPILTKQDIRQNFKQLIVSEQQREKPFLNASSGSTVKPLKYYIDRQVFSVNRAGILRGWGWAGYRLGDRVVTLAGDSMVKSNSASLTGRLRNLIERNLPLGAAQLDEKILSDYAAKISSYQPKFIRGYASAIYLLAAYLKDTNRTNIKPQAVFTTAEMLLPRQRKLIELQLDCTVFDQYGCYDGGVQAMECAEHCGFHVSVEKVVLEIVDEKQKAVTPGTAGDIIATDLENYTMPFIRYRVGDRAIMTGEPCRCGRGLPLMKSLLGRSSDFITTPGGARVHRVFFDHILEAMPAVKQFQVVQENRERLILKIIPEHRTSECELKDIRNSIPVKIADKTGIDNISVKFVNDIPRTSAGKWKFVISHVQQK